MDKGLRKKVAIIGVGFMGGSLALDLREKFSDFEVWGYARNQSSYDRIKNSNVVDKVEQDLNKVVKGADFVVLGLPVLVIIDYLKKIAPLLKKGAVVFDLGSSKELVEKAAKKYMPKGTYFVGCHPLCGAETGGVEFSSKNLYNGAHCIITASAAMKATKVIASLWQKLGTKVTYMSPRLHDKILSSVSHLPHLISFSITEFISKEYVKFSARSLRDLTRISNSPPSVWVDIFLSNKRNLRRDLQGFIKVLKKFDSAIKEEDRKKIINLIKKANTKYKLLSDTV